MTRREAKQKLEQAFFQGSNKCSACGTSGTDPNYILDLLDSCLHFEPEIAEMSAVCRGVGRTSNGG